MSAQGAEAKTSKDESFCSKILLRKEKHMCRLALLTLGPQEGAWHGLASAARPEESHLVGKVGVWKGRAANTPFIIHTESQTGLDWRRP